MKGIGEASATAGAISSTGGSAPVILAKSTRQGPCTSSTGQKI